MSASNPQPSNFYAAGHEPSFTAMWHACLRHTHAVAHDSPIFSDTRRVGLVPADVRRRVLSVMHGYSRETADAIVLRAVVRHRLLADRLELADRRGDRQLVILGAGPDTTAFELPSWGRALACVRVGHYRPDELQLLIREAGFADVSHHDVNTLNARYLAGRHDRLRLHPIEQLITAHQARS